MVFGVDDTEINGLWMPEVQRTPRRGLIELFGNKYSLPTLVDLLPENEPARVRFDIHRAEKVWVLDMDGRLLGEAVWDGHKHAAFPVPFIERKAQERVERYVKEQQARIDAKADELLQTLDVPTRTVLDLPVPPQPELVQRVPDADKPAPEVIKPMPVPKQRSVLETMEFLLEAERAKKAGT
jgi:putative transposase